MCGILRARRLQGGLTMIEVMVTIVLMSGLLLISLTALQGLRRNADIDTTTQHIVATLQLARNKTLASQNESSYGVHFESDQYVLFTGTTYDSAATDNEVHELTPQLEINDISVTGGSDVVFDRVYGTTSNDGTVTIRVAAEPTKTKTISILPSGQTGLTGTVSPTDTRITDTRHLHFDLGWSIQGATTLTLVFSDPPNPDVQVDVTMSSYFNGGQTEFDWEEIIDVNGSNQTLRVHTHTLDAANTLLSVHRDGRYNDKAVTISIDAQDIVSYDAGGTATVGTFGGTMEEQ